MAAMHSQLEADREHMALLKDTLETIYVAQRQGMADHTALSQKIDRMDLAVEAHKANAQRLLGEISQRINGAVDMKFGPMAETVDIIQKELVKKKQDDERMRDYLEKLNAERPAEGATVVETSKAFYEDLHALKLKLGEFE